MVENFDSNEEMYFKWFLDELLTYECIRGYKYHPKPFILSQSLYFDVQNQKRPESKPRQISIMQGHQYQADFVIYWTNKLKNIIWAPLAGSFYENPKSFPFLANFNKENSVYYTVVDVKGSFSGPHNNSAISFPLNQKWVWSKYSILVQKVVTHPRVTKKGDIVPSNALFSKFFVPEKFIYTNKSGEKRKIVYPIRKIDQYLVNTLKLS